MKTIKVPKGKSFRSKLKAMWACGPAQDWVGKKSFHTAWNTCQDAGWMLWLVGYFSQNTAEKATRACVKHFIPELPKGYRRAAKRLLSGEPCIRPDPLSHRDDGILDAAAMAGTFCTWGAAECLPPCADIVRAKVPEAKVAAWLEKM